MDVSTLFRASVKAVSLKNEAFATESVQIKPSVKKQYSSFRKKSQNVVTQISKLRDFLLENRADYLNFSSHLLTKNRLTDKQRDEIDRGAQEIISTCSQLIKELKRDIANTEMSQQTQEHREIMLHLTEEYLRNVCKIYSEQKAIRVKKTIELRNLSKLELNIKPQRSLDHLTEQSRPSSSSELSLERRETPTPVTSSPLKVQEMNGDVSPLIYEEELSAEDVQMFQSENELLYNELNTITEEVKQIESKVVHIAELQGIFTEKVLTQDRDLDKLMTTVVGSTENVKEANEQIRQAIQRNAGLRVWILFFLLVMSFSLLFLDWYNP